MRGSVEWWVRVGEASPSHLLRPSRQRAPLSSLLVARQSLSVRGPLRTWSAAAAARGALADAAGAARLHS